MIHEIADWLIAFIAVPVAIYIAWITAAWSLVMVGTLVAVIIRCWPITLLVSSFFLFIYLGL